MPVHRHENDTITPFFLQKNNFIYSMSKYKYFLFIMNTWVHFLGQMCHSSNIFIIHMAFHLISVQRIFPAQPEHGERARRGHLPHMLQTSSAQGLHSRRRPPMRGRHSAPANNGRTLDCRQNRPSVRWRCHLSGHAPPFSAMPTPSPTRGPVVDRQWLRRLTSPPVHGMANSFR